MNDLLLQSWYLWALGLLVIYASFILLLGRPGYVSVEGQRCVSPARWLGFHLELLGDFALLGYVGLDCRLLAEFTYTDGVVGQVHVGRHRY